MPAESELLAEVEEVYLEDDETRRLAVASAKTEAAGYCRTTRIEDIMDFARRIGAEKLGIAHCVGLMQEARMARDIFRSNGFEVYAACCKVGSYVNRSLPFTNCPLPGMISLPDTFFCFASSFTVQSSALLPLIFH